MARSLLLLATLAVLVSCFLAEAKVVKRDRRGVVAVQGALLVPKRRDRDEQDLSKIPGVAGVDFPVFRSVPPTHFHCGNVPATPGMYANVETGCQGHQGASFLCPNGTLFNQQEFACDWWYNVDCAQAPTLYSLNLDPLKNPYFPKPQAEEQKKLLVL
ncbi:hypothetical protein B566_EDAN012327 [Ephemera danica]|nr:hypothetical protein B566_EDAN012327 [Ephemera danica]